MVLSGAFLPNSARIFLIFTYTPDSFGNCAPKILFLIWYVNVVASDLLINTDVCSRFGEIRLCDQTRHSTSCSPRNLKLTLVSGHCFFSVSVCSPPPPVVQLQLAWMGAFRGKQSSLVVLCPTECDVQSARGKTHKIKFTHNTRELDWSHNNPCRLTNYSCVFWLFFLMPQFDTFIPYCFHVVVSSLQREACEEPHTRWKLKQCPLLQWEMAANFLLSFLQSSFSHHSFR